MALFNEILVGRYNRFLQKLLAMKGGPPAPQLATEIGTNIQLFHGVENRYLEGWQRFGGQFSVPAAGVGNVGGFRFPNPAGNNVITAVEWLLCSSVAAGLTDLFQILIGPNISADLATIVSPNSQALDSRHMLLSGSSMSVSAAAAPSKLGLGSIMQSGILTASAGFQFINDESQEFPITPGSAMQVGNFTTNQAFVVNVLWRERFLEDSERT